LAETSSSSTRYGPAGSLLLSQRRYFCAHSNCHYVVAEKNKRKVLSQRKGKLRKIKERKNISSLHVFDEGAFLSVSLPWRVCFVCDLEYVFIIKTQCFEKCL
jgi:hypothetical protein